MVNNMERKVMKHYDKTPRIFKISFLYVTHFGKIKKAEKTALVLEYKKLNCILFSCENRFSVWLMNDLYFLVVLYNLYQICGFSYLEGNIQTFEQHLQVVSCSKLLRIVANLQLL